MSAYNKSNIVCRESPGLAELQLINSHQPSGPRPLDRITEHPTLSERNRRQEKKKRVGDSSWDLTNGYEPSPKRQNTISQRRPPRTQVREPSNVDHITRSDASRNINVAKKSDELVNGLSGGSPMQSRELRDGFPEEKMFLIPQNKLIQYHKDKMVLGDDSDEDNELTVDGGSEVVYTHIRCLDQANCLV